jgi:hypothetical protein
MLAPECDDDLAKTRQCMCFPVPECGPADMFRRTVVSFENTHAHAGTRCRN